MRDVRLRLDRAGREAGRLGIRLQSFLIAMIGRQPAVAAFVNRSWRGP